MFRKIFAAKRILALAAAAVIGISMSGCSNGYKMTEEDLALQESLVGYWAADNSTGYNEFDENGTLTKMTSVQFTDDFHYILHIYYPTQNPAEDPSRFLSLEPESYTIEDGKFCVEKNGLKSYAAIGISEDGSQMSWITDDGTDKYIRISDQDVEDLRFPVYDPNKQTETGSDADSYNVNVNGEDVSGEEVGGEETAGEETAGEEGSGGEDNTEEG